MATAHFMTEQYLKDNTPVTWNVNIKEIYPFARTAEEIYIQEAIGSKLFDRLVESLNASPKNTTADEITLLKKIRSSLVWFTLFDALPFLDFKIRSIGVVRQSGDNLQNAGRDDISYLRKECKNKADFYLRRVQDYLCEFQELYSEYRTGTWGCSEMFPNSNVSNSSDLAIDKNDSTSGYDTEFAREWLND
jgi:hypothetical protein